MFLVTVTHEPKKIEDFIHFSAEAIDYNSVTTKPDVKIDMTVIYPLQSPKFKYLGQSCLNIKLQSNYFISGLIRILKSGKIMIQATDIDYLKTSMINANLSENSSVVIPNAPSIIDIIDDDLDSAQVPEKLTAPIKTFVTT
ncbi:13387_t:CDS:1, partial [Racocetra fulgida]